MATLQEYEARLTQAEDALHKILTGTGVGEVWRDGRRVVFTKADAKSLRAYIAELKSTIAAMGGAQTTSSRAPARPVFG